MADTGDVSTLHKVFAGATAIFAVTDYWSPFFSLPPPKTPEGRPLQEYDYDNELNHGQNVADAAAAVDTLIHFIWSALLSLKKASNGKYSGIYHFDSKGAIDYIREKQIELAKKMSVIYMSFYISNILLYDMMKPNKAHQMPCLKKSTQLTT